MYLPLGKIHRKSSLRAKTATVWSVNVNGEKNHLMEIYRNNWQACRLMTERMEPITHRKKARVCGKREIRMLPLYMGKCPKGRLNWSQEVLAFWIMSYQGITFPRYFKRFFRSSIYEKIRSFRKMFEKVQQLEWKKSLFSQINHRFGELLEDKYCC